MKSRPFFSIVIPTLNEEQYLPFLLEDLVEQTYQDFEVVHIDGNSDDSTVSIATTFKEILFINTHTTKIRNVSFQRNLGIQESKGSWVIFMDADTRLPAYFLDGIRYRLARKPETDVFTTWVEIDSDRTLNQPIEQTINFGLELGKTINKEWSLGALIGAKKSILSDNFLFDQNQKVGEDGMFVKKLVDYGFTFSLFRDPKYTFSVRRFDSEGTIKIARIAAKLALNYLQGKDFSENDFGYKMEGGSAYTKHKIFDYYTLQKLLKNATQKQIDETKKLFSKLTSRGL